MSDLSADHLAKISWLVTDCGKRSQHLAANPFQVYEKGVQDYVTDVDRALDQYLSDGFSALFPEDGIISEENTASRQAFAKNYRRLWLIDPLDGTEDFIKGKSHYAVMVGLLEANQPRLGWIYAPVLQQLYFGGAEVGLFEAQGDAAPTPIIPKAPVLTSEHCPILIGDKDLRRYGEAIAQRIPQAQFSSLGSFGLKVMEVVCGRAGLYIYFNRRVKLWDTVGPLAIAQAAGLECCDLEGNPIEFIAEVVDGKTLMHHQPILVGWSHYMQQLRSPIREAVLSINPEFKLTVS